VSKPRIKKNSKSAVEVLDRVFRSIGQEYLEPPDPPATLYHYCREDVLEMILRSGNLWASDILSMHDKR
jgi:hypothetical protein